MAHRYSDSDPQTIADVLGEDEWDRVNGARFAYRPGFEGVECPGDDRCECH